jgi:hypothetical protein
MSSPSSTRSSKLVHLVVGIKTKQLLELNPELRLIPNIEFASPCTVWGPTGVLKIESSRKEMGSRVHTVEDYSPLHGLVFCWRPHHKD